MEKVFFGCVIHRLYPCHVTLNSGSPAFFTPEGLRSFSRFELGVVLSLVQAAVGLCRY